MHPERNTTSNNDRAVEGTLEQTFDGTPEGVRRALADCIASLRALGVSDGQIVNMEVVLAEVLNNVVEHGYADVEDGKIFLRIVAEDQTLRILCRDNGVPMPGLNAPDPGPPDLDVPLNELQEGAFGWFMIRAIAADIKYERQDGCNYLSLNLGA